MYNTWVVDIYGVVQCLNSGHIVFNITWIVDIYCVVQYLDSEQLQCCTLGIGTIKYLDMYRVVSYLDSEQVLCCTIPE